MKKLLISTIIAFTLVGMYPSVSFGDSSSNLLQMDIKKSTATDTVDVTFYTTGDPSNTVVTRKSSNRYVVLLPNTSGSSSVVPNLGGVKDLVTDVQVKNVDDGIGGYTKVTFGTTKPINIKTYTKKTAPLSQAQKDYKNLIAKSNSTNFATQTTKVSAVTPTQKKVAESANKTSTAKKAPSTKLKFDNAQNTPPALKTTTSNKIATKKSTENIIKANFEKPKTKEKPIVDNNAKLAVNTTNNKSENNISSEKPVNNTITQVPGNEPIKTIDKIPQNNDIKSKIALLKNSLLEKIQNNNANNSGSKFKNFFLFGFGIIALMMIVATIINKLHNALMTQTQTIWEDYNVQENVPNKKEEYNDLLNTDGLNWQEKYKMFSQQQNPTQNHKDLSYVANIRQNNATVKNTLYKENNEIAKPTAKPTIKPYSIKPATNADIKPQQSIPINNIPILETTEKKYNRPRKSQETNEFVQQENKKTTPELISEPTKKNVRRASIIRPEIEKPVIENQIIKEPEFEDFIIEEPINEVKLTKFAKNKNMSKPQNNVSKSNRPNDKVPKLKNTTTIKGKKSNTDYLIDDDIEYSTSTVYDYLSMVDNEGSDKLSNISENNVSKHIPSKTQAKQEQITTNKNATNPINNKKTTQKSTNGLAIKSGYDIEKNKSIYLVDMAGKSALVGRINDSIFVLKKFDNPVNGKVKVTKDKPNSYIVKVANYKSIVNVNNEKMSTLVEI